MDNGEFEKEARRLHGLRVARIEAMTEEEKVACDRFMMPGMLERYKRLEFNQHVPVKTVEYNISECVKHYRNDLWQSSDEYAVALRESVRRRGDRDFMDKAKDAYYEKYFPKYEEKWEHDGQGNLSEATPVKKEPEAQSRGDKIKAAMRYLKERPHEGKWTKSGKPYVTSVEKECGFDITPKERNKFWKEVN